MEALGYGQLAARGQLLVFVGYFNSLCFFAAKLHRCFAYRSRNKLIALYITAALFRYGVFAGGNIDVSRETVARIQRNIPIEVIALNVNDHFIVLGLIYAFNCLVYADVCLFGLLFGVAVSNRYSCFRICGKCYTALGKSCVLRLYKIVPIYA